MSDYRIQMYSKIYDIVLEEFPDLSRKEFKEHVHQAFLESGQQSMMEIGVMSMSHRVKARILQEESKRIDGETER